MTSGACEATTVTEGVNKSCAKDERPPQRRLVSTAANEVLYQLSTAPAAKYTRESCVSAGTRGTVVQSGARSPYNSPNTHLHLTHTKVNSV